MWLGLETGGFGLTGLGVGVGTREGSVRGVRGMVRSLCLGFGRVISLWVR